MMLDTTVVVDDNAEQQDERTEPQQEHLRRGGTDYVVYRRRKNQNHAEKQQSDIDDQNKEENDNNKKMIIIPADTQVMEGEMELHARYPEPLQITESFDEIAALENHDSQEMLELENTNIETALGPVLNGKSDPMAKLHELVSHQCLHEEPAILSTEVTITEKGSEVEDREEEENDSNIQQINTETGLSPTVASKLKKVRIFDVQMISSRTWKMFVVILLVGGAIWGRDCHVAGAHLDLQGCWKQ
ncbi:hypothetical protein RDI58_007130 [Solanum bulbocastanum]|uniref:Uncharacterized protein n=1 Tax=Solanum bulbocastanum TaxID=147425 RepID=A0AAN8YIK9_SOLBU